ncbi:MAG: hypothetical protein QOF21_462 [Actinomycetota bacterium]|jgi:uncharacterized protein (DUF1800 family)
MTDQGRDLLAHLFRRAGFGAKTADLDAYSTRGYIAAVNDLLASSAATPKPALRLPVAVPLLAPAATLDDAQTGWVKQMVTTNAVLVERMTLFLSNHFATAFTPGDHIDAAAMTNQQAKIRSGALGNFKDLTHAMVDDLALGVYLNSERSMKTVPNENLGRELMELFLLGPGNYTEADVKQAARALTGYQLTKTLIGGWQFTYNKNAHDDGLKTVLGVTAAFNPHSLVDFLLARPAASRFIATKLVTHFVSTSPDTAIVTAVAQSLARNWSLSDALRVIFLSSQFKAPSIRQTLVKMPAEYVTGAMRALGRTEYRDGALFMSAAGQTLFRPATVAGWPQGQSLLGAGSMLARYNTAAKLATFHMAKPSAAAPSGPELRTWAEGFGMTSLAPRTEAALTAYANATTNQTTQTRVGGLITLLAASPDFNLA